MKLLRLYRLYLKKYKFYKYIVIAQYCFMFFILYFMLPILRNYAKIMIIAKQYPMNKIVYYNNVEALRLNSGNYVNHERLVSNIGEFTKIIEGEKNISSIFPIVSSVHIVTPEGEDTGASIYDKNSFSFLTKKHLKESNDIVYAVVNGSLKMIDRYKIGQIYPFKIESNGEFFDIKVEIVDYLTEEEQLVIYPGVTSNSDVELTGIVRYKKFEPDDKGIFFLDSPSISMLQKYRNSDADNYSKLIYFKEETPQEQIDSFVKRVNDKDIGYAQSNLKFIEKQEARFWKEVSKKADRLIAFIGLLILSLISIAKVTMSKIREFHKVLSMLGYTKFKIYLLNFIYNISIFLISLGLFNIYDSYQKGGIVAKIFNHTAWNNDYILFGEKLAIVGFFVVVNLLLTIYIYLSSKEERDGIY
ncbi:hypothetical protein ACQRBF_02380 [Peptoniphilaceae bacterium SGI.131]